MTHLKAFATCHLTHLTPRLPTGWASCDDVLEFNTDTQAWLLKNQTFSARYGKSSFQDSCAFAARQPQVPNELKQAKGTGLVGAPLPWSGALAAVLRGDLFRAGQFVVQRQVAANAIQHAVFVQWYGFDSRSKTYYAHGVEFASFVERHVGHMIVHRIVGCTRPHVQLKLQELRVIPAFNTSTAKGARDLLSAEHGAVLAHTSHSLNASVDPVNLARLWATPPHFIPPLSMPLIHEGVVALLPAPGQKCALCGFAETCTKPDGASVPLGPMVGYTRGYLRGDTISGLPMGEPAMAGAPPTPDHASAVTQRVASACMSHTNDPSQVIWVHCLCLHLGLSRVDGVALSGPDCNVVSALGLLSGKHPSSHSHDRHAPGAVIKCGKRGCKRQYHLPTLLMHGWDACEEAGCEAHAVDRPELLHSLTTSDDPASFISAPADLPDSVVLAWSVHFMPPTGMHTVLLMDGTTARLPAGSPAWQHPQLSSTDARCEPVRGDADIGRVMLVSKSVLRDMRPWQRAAVASTISPSTLASSITAPDSVAHHKLRNPKALSHEGLPAGMLDYLAGQGMFGCTGLRICFLGEAVERFMSPTFQAAVQAYAGPPQPVMPMIDPATQDAALSADQQDAEPSSAATTPSQDAAAAASSAAAAVGQKRARSSSNASAPAPAYPDMSQSSSVVQVESASTTPAATVPPQPADGSADLFSSTDTPAAVPAGPQSGPVDPLFAL